MVKVVLAAVVAVVDVLLVLVIVTAVVVVAVELVVVMADLMAVPVAWIVIAGVLLQWRLWWQFLALYQFCLLDLVRVYHPFSKSQIAIGSPIGPVRLAD